MELYDPETIVSSVITFFSLLIVRLPSHNELYNWVQEQKKEGLAFQIIGTSAQADYPVNKCDIAKSTILLLGNETVGLSRNYKEIADAMVEIPIDGVASSLYVSCATSIVLYEIKRQRYLS